MYIICLIHMPHIYIMVCPNPHMCTNITKAENCPILFSHLMVNDGRNWYTFNIRVTDRIWSSIHGITNNFCNDSLIRSLIEMTCNELKCHFFTSDWSMDPKLDQWIQSIAIYHCNPGHGCVYSRILDRIKLYSRNVYPGMLKHQQGSGSPNRLDRFQKTNPVVIDHLLTATTRKGTECRYSMFIYNNLGTVNSAKEYSDYTD